jgi:AcrR family transcriptional regulator/DNA-binding transcriptional regulator YhcF (GntR family)
VSAAPPPTEPPYRRIVSSFRARIESGELPAGQRVPSIRQIAAEWHVAVATATRAMGILRDEGLVTAKVGSGTVVSERLVPGAAVPRTAHANRPRVHGGPETHRSAVTRREIIDTALAVADSEGLDSVSMRRLAAQLGIGPMALYRYVESKDDLITSMADAVFGRAALPDPGPRGWRPKLELVCRLHWELFRRHPWLLGVVSLTRPLMAPNAMAHTEWTLRAMDGLELPAEVRIREALTLPATVMAIAQFLAAEVEAGRESGVTADQWRDHQERHAQGLVTEERFPHVMSITSEMIADLEGLFEFALACHLDGFALLVGRDRPHGSP